MFKAIKDKTYSWLLRNCYKGLDKAANRSIPAALNISSEFANRDIARGIIPSVTSKKDVALNSLLVDTLFAASGDLPSTTINKLTEIIVTTYGQNGLDDIIYMYERLLHVTPYRYLKKMRPVLDKVESTLSKIIANGVTPGSLQQAKVRIAEFKKELEKIL